MDRERILLICSRLSQIFQVVRFLHQKKQLKTYQLDFSFLAGMGFYFAGYDPIYDYLSVEGEISSNNNESQIK